uniref:Uncharacterized protein n=1 Tax=Arundo donax TaxID=35708 RepID=A0A0A9SJ77_ARUDO
MPLFGTGPDSWFTERFRLLRRWKLSRNSGMGPDNLLLERSNSSRPFNAVRSIGICPWRRFSCRYRNCNSRQLPRVLGISPDNLFDERSIMPMFTKCPICGGMGPINALLEMLHNSVREEMLTISCGICPLRRLFEISMEVNMLRLPRVAGILPSR